MRFGTWPTAQQSTPTSALSLLTQRVLFLSSPKSAQVAGNPCPLALPKTAVAASFKNPVLLWFKCKIKQFTCRFHGDIAKEVSAPAHPGWS